MTRIGFVFALAVAICPVMRAGTIVTTSLSLTSLTITPNLGGDSGLVQIQPGVYGPVFVGVFDSLGDLDTEFNFNIDGPASISATVPLASASAAADGSLLTASATSGVNIPGLNANAGTDPDGDAQLSGTFEIVDTTNTGANPVSVLFSAALATSQSLFTDAFGISASSEVTFQFSLPDIGAVPFLYYDNLLAIGSGQSLSAASSPTLSASTTLLTNTPYSFFLEADSESNGADSAVPEPASVLLLASGLAALAVSRARRG
jgi:hypothetical protein